MGSDASFFFSAKKYFGKKKDESHTANNKVAAGRRKRTRNPRRKERKGVQKRKRKRKTVTCQCAQIQNRLSQFSMQKLPDLPKSFCKLQDISFLPPHTPLPRFPSTNTTFFNGTLMEKAGETLYFMGNALLHWVGEG